MPIVDHPWGPCPRSPIQISQNFSYPGVLDFDWLIFFNLKKKSGLLHFFNREMSIDLFLKSGPLVVFCPKCTQLDKTITKTLKNQFHSPFLFKIYQKITFPTNI